MSTPFALAHVRELILTYVYYFEIFPALARRVMPPNSLIQPTSRDSEYKIVVGI